MRIRSSRRKLDDDANPQDEEEPFMRSKKPSMPVEFTPRRSAGTPVYKGRHHYVVRRSQRKPSASYRLQYAIGIG